MAEEQSIIPQDFLEEIAIRHGISDAELKVLSYAMEGVSTEAIGKKLGIETQVVRNRLREVYRRFQIGGMGPGKLAKLQRHLISEYQSRGAIKTSPPVTAKVVMVSEKKTPHRDWGESPDVSLFYGRAEELDTLKGWIVANYGGAEAPTTNSCRVVAILGMGGMGKSTLSKKLAEEIQGEFDYIIWRSLGNEPSLENLLGDVIAVLSDRSETNLPQDIDGGISLLLSYLTNNRCLLILDELETILPLVVGASAPQINESLVVGASAPHKYEGYSKLLTRIAQTQHQSCLLLISQEAPPEIPLPANSTPFVRSYQLKGLKLEDAIKIFQNKELSGEEQWEDLIRFAKGNPLSLNIIAAYIQDVFNGNVTEFAKYQTWIFGDLRDILDQQFQRFFNLEKQILQSLANQANSLSFFTLKQTLPESLATSEIIEALASLKRRDWIETSNKDKHSPETLYTIPDMVKKYVTKYQLKSTY